MPFKEKLPLYEQEKLSSVMQAPAAIRELRFTRNLWGFLTLLLLALSLVNSYLIFSFYALYFTPFFLVLFGLCELSFLLLCAAVARYFLKYALYIITPLGIEILPLYKPRKNHQLIPWSEVEKYQRISPSKIAIKTPAQTFTLSLRALLPSSRQLFFKAMDEQYTKVLLDLE